MSQAKRPWVQGRNEFAAALWHTEGVWLRALLVVPVPVLMVLLAPLVCDSTKKQKTLTSSHTGPSKYTRQTRTTTNKPRTNHEETKQ